MAMISNFSLDKENMGFDFVDRDGSVLNGIRRKLIGGVEVHTLNVTSIDTNSENIIYEQIARMFSMIYVNQKKVKNVKLKFDLRYKCSDDYEQVFSNKVKFHLDGKDVKPVIRQDLYLFTIKKNQHINIEGDLKFMKRSLIGFMSQKPMTKGKYRCSMNILEMCSPFHTISFGIGFLLKEVEKFKGMFKKTSKKTSLGKVYTVDDYDRGTLNAIVVEINQELYKNVINCGICVSHYSLDEKKLRFDGKDPDGTIDKACDNIIKKLKDITKSVSTNIGKDKDFNRVIDDY